MFAVTRRLTLRPAWPEEAGELVWLLPANAMSHRATLCVIATRDGGLPRIVGTTWVAAGTDDRDFGIAIAPDACGHGYATEAGRAMLGIARYALGLRRLAARASSADHGTRRLLGKLGFHEVQVPGRDDAADLAYAITLNLRAAASMSARRSHEQPAVTPRSATSVAFGVTA